MKALVSGESSIEFKPVIEPLRVYTAMNVQFILLQEWKMALAVDHQRSPVLSAFLVWFPLTGLGGQSVHTRW